MQPARQGSRRIPVVIVANVGIPQSRMFPTISTRLPLATYLPTSARRDLWAVTASQGQKIKEVETMGTIWRIDPKSQEREQITVKPGDIWQDDRRWKLRMLNGIHTASKARCEMLRRLMIKDGLISD